MILTFIDAGSCLPAMLDDTIQKVKAPIRQLYVWSQEPSFLQINTRLDLILQCSAENLFESELSRFTDFLFDFTFRIPRHLRLLADALVHQNVSVPGGSIHGGQELFAQGRDLHNRFPFLPVNVFDVLRTTLCPNGSHTPIILETLVRGHYAARKVPASEADIPQPNLDSTKIP